MNKNEFLSLLSDGLSGRMTAGEINEHINFYSEAIDDRIEEGLSESDAVLDMGDIDSIISDIIGESRPAKKEKKKRTFKAWEIALLILGSPLWLSLLIAAFAIIIALLCALWSVVVSLWSVFASFAACSLGGLLSGVSFIFEGYGFSGASMIACSLFFAGLSIFAFFGCRALTKGSAWLTANTFIGIKNLFTKKEEV